MAFFAPDAYMDSLISLLRYHNRNLPPIIPHIQKILDLCKQRWVCDFLFNEDAAHLPFLTGPLFRRHAVVCKVTASRFQPPILPSPHFFEYEGSMAMVPAFSIENISVGFGVEEKWYRSSHQLGCEDSQSGRVETPAHNEEFRYVRDDSTGAMVILHDYGNCFQLEYVSHLSPTCRQRSTSRFKRHMLKPLLLQAVNTVVDDDSLVSAIICLQISDEFRTCPMCGTTPDLPCNCKLGLLPPRHPLDFSNNHKHMVSHRGAYEGLAHSGKFSNGKLENRAIFGSKIEVRDSSAPELVNRLASWAVERHMQSAPQDPLAAVFPNPEWRDESRHGGLLPATVQTTPAFGGAVEESVKEAAPLRFGGVGHPVLAPQKSSARFISDERHALFSAGNTSVPDIRPQMSAGQVLHRVSSMRTTARSSSGHHEPGEEGGQGRTDRSPKDTEWEKLMEVKQNEKRERNRASAHRSNMRKKVANDARKLELRILHEKESKLRTRERELRQENVHLRKLLRPYTLPTPRAPTSQ